VPAINVAIYLYIAGRNSGAKPFVWTASVDDIIKNVTRGKSILWQGIVSLQFQFYGAFPM
jgi:hypothetical protein